ncbi:DNA-binding response regulator [Roseovarius aestuariivivens]|uniref:response regulator transcription factor n=1 Tax=Roseovarius aestuariivivens TaxID=1888910 RepID=UPI001FD8A171|nr:DNA-binding response regulator [Roseovarius aestuariivivens]
MPPDVAHNPIAMGRFIALAIDDAPETLGLVSRALEENGVTVLVARSGEEGIALAQRVQPDVILMDAVMPGLDGFETCRRLKATPNATSAPVIFMTGMSESEHILRGLQAGGVDYITKPVVIEELLARITTHVLNARAIQSARAALQYAGQTVVAFATDGRVSWGTPNAVERVTEAGLVENGAATAAVQTWLSRLGSQPMSAAKPYANDRLTLVYLGQVQGEIVVRIKEDTAGTEDERLARTFNLTAREAQVLLWLSHGKTNRDIAEILSLSARTVNKHLEQIFHKMGVDNRTSAAVMADRALHGA